MKRATASVLGNLFEIGINEITDGSKAFINFDYDFLLSDSIELIEPDNLVIEVLEDVQADQKLVRKLTTLKEKGYIIALDDFKKNYDECLMAPLSHIIKYDIIATPLESIRAEVNTAIRHGKIVLAEKIETKEEYERAKEIGFTLFQGYFFKKPSIISQSNDKKSIKLNYLRILSELQKPEPSYNEITSIIETDVNLAYRLLRIVKNNSKDNDNFYSIKKSLVFMGFKEISRWINILMLQDLSTDKPMKLMRLSLTRSQFGNSLAKRSQLKSRIDEISTMLLFSILDALLDLPIEDALDNIYLTEDIRDSLITNSGPLSPILNLVYAYETASWEEAKAISNDLHIKEDEIYKDYLQALQYCKKIEDSL